MITIQYFYIYERGFSDEHSIKNKGTNRLKIGKLENKLKLRKSNSDYLNLTVSNWAKKIRIFFKVKERKIGPCKI